MANGNVEIVEGDIRDRGARARADARHRRRLPPGRDPHHAVRGGAAAGARGPRRRHLQRRRGRGRRRACARSSPPRRRRSTAWPRSSRPTSTTTRTPTTRSTARPRSFNEGLLRSFHAMYGLDYVALRYFNVYGPRMDVHGVYTEVLVRWMERIAAGEPPLILGDGLQTMDFVYVGDIARANVLAAESDADRRGLQRRQRHRDEPARARRGAAAGHGLRPRRSSTARARAVNGVTRRLADTHAGARAARLRGRGRPRRGPDAAGRLVARRARRRADRPVAAGEGVVMEVPFARPSLTGGDGAAVAEAVASGWVSQGPRVAAFEAAFAERVGAPDAVATTNCTTALHLALYVVGRRPRRRGHRPVAVVHRHRQRGLAVRRDAGLRRRRPAHLQPRPGVGRARDHRAHEGDHARAPGRAAGRHGRRSSRSPTRYGLTLVEDAACAIGAHVQGPADRLARARWPASRCTRARSSPPARAA